MKYNVSFFVVLALVFTVGVGVVNAQSIDDGSGEYDGGDDTAEIKTMDEAAKKLIVASSPHIIKDYKETGRAAATRVRKAFLKAKKAFHTARQEIQAIKKGDEDPRKDLPRFFDDEEDDNTEEEDN